MKQGQFPAVFQLADVNGKNGFKLDGEVSNDGSGQSVSAAGDINGDGHADLLIGAANYANYMGRSYVVFGGPNTGVNGTILLSSLNGTYGFILDGEVSGNDFSGTSVSGGGDVNGDGHADLLIGAYGHSFVGRSYVIFGGTNVGSGGVIPLASLNGTNGFKLDGESSGDNSGYPVNVGRDINGDGYLDILIGSDGYANFTGRGYVVFGGLNVSMGDIVSLSSLNGTNGFKLDGEASLDFSSRSMGTGDINDDGYADVLIGAPDHATGRGYVVFGGPTVSIGGMIMLSSLDGANGFKLDGEMNGDSAGKSINSVGDINGDGPVDLIIGASGYANFTGRTYVVFGGSAIGAGGTIALSGLNGTNGFKLEGELTGDYSGASVSAAGDINGDGYVDLLIGAPHPDGVSCSYVVFGGPNVGRGGSIALSDLNGINGFKLAGEINGDASGNSVSTTGDINGDGVTDILIGAPGRNAGRSYVIYGDIPPVLVNNRLSLSVGAAITLNTTFLAAYDRNHNNNTLVFVPAAVKHGRFEAVGAPGISLTNFTQQQVAGGTIQFVHDGSAFAPSYTMTVRSDGIAWAGPSPVNMTFSQAPIVLVHNQLSIGNGSQVIVLPSELQAVKANYNSSQLLFLLSEVQHGYFTLTEQNSTKLSSFIQAQIDHGEITFIHAGDGQAPSYQVMVSDGVQYTVPSVPMIHFIGAPIIIKNTLTLQVGESVTLTLSDLNVNATDGSTPGQVICQVSDLQHAVFTRLLSGLPISNFTLADLQSGEIQVTQDNSNYAAVSYVISCGGQQGIQSVPSTVDTHFSYQGISAPRLVQNYLLIAQGESVSLTQQNIVAMENGSQPLSDSAFFYISAVTHGQFSLSTSPGNIVTFFSQEQLQNGDVVFTQDNSKQAPGYRLSVQALGLESASLPAAVIFRPVNQPPTLSHALTDQSATIGKSFSYAIPPDTFADPEGESLELLVSRFNSSLGLPSWLKFDGLNNRFSGVPVIDDLIDINVTARDAQGLSVTTDFVLEVTPAAPLQETGFSTWQKTIIGALISGSIGIGFVLMQICMKRAANKKLMTILGEGDTAYEREVVRPVMKEITQRIKINRFMNAITNKELMAFKSAVRSLLSALDRRQVNLNFGEMQESKRDELINEIGHQTYRWMKARQRGCAKCCPGLHAFFKPQITAEDLQGGVDEIADQIVEALQVKTRLPQISLSAGLSVSASPVYKDYKRKSSVDLSLPDAPASPSQHRLAEEVSGGVSVAQLS